MSLLHELENKWRARADAIDAEMPPVTEWGTNNFALAGSADVLHSCANELAAALAGGGEAVALSEKATPGPWHAIIRGSYGFEPEADVNGLQPCRLGRMSLNGACTRRSGFCTTASNTTAASY